MKPKNLKKLVEIYDNLEDVIMEEITKLPAFGKTCECKRPVMNNSVTSNIRYYCLRCGGTPPGDSFTRGDLY